MELTNEFTVAVEIERAWAVLTDLERIAPCLPGAQLREVEGDEYRGGVKVKVGPITTSYDGAVRVVERDEAAHRFVMGAEGRETRGQGNASAIITATLSAEGASTRVRVDTDLAVTGKVAQFGRGVMAEVSAKLLDQFAKNLEVMVLSGGEEPSPVPEPVVGGDDPAAAPDPSGDDSAVRYIDAAPVEPVDLLEVAGGSLGRRVVRPLVIAVAALGLFTFARRRRR